jgi:hypothetical protein
MSSQFIGREDWEGNNGNSVVTENVDENAADAKAGEYTCNFLEVATHRL